MKHTRHWLGGSIPKVLAWGTFVVFFLSLVLVATFTTSYQQCTADREHFYGKEAPSYGENAANFIVCEGMVIDANSALLTAIATVLIAAFTLTLYEATNKQGRLTQQSVDLARAEFLATHRPRIKVRAVSAPQGQPSQPMTFKVVIVNAGESTAVITKHNISALLLGRDEGVEVGLLPHQGSPTITLKTGEGYVFEKVATYPWDMAQWMALHNREEEFVALGAITYADEAGIVRHMSFSRAYDYERGTYSVSKRDPENEYED